MRNRASLLALLTSLALSATHETAHAQLGNMQYEASEVGKTLASFGATAFGGGPGGSNTVIMLNGYMIVMGSYDSGKPNGPLHTFDVKNPRAPQMVKRFTSPETEDLRELHAMPVALLDGKTILVLTSTKGIRFFDFTDPLNPQHVGALALEGVNGGDYDNAAWMLSWVWPYVYVGGTGNGVYIVDATDPAQAKLVTRVQTGELGGFTVGPTYGAGNYVVVSGMDDKPTKVSVIDVADPTQPFLSATGSATGEMYSMLVIGDRVYGTGGGGNYSFMKWSPDAVESISSKKFGSEKGGYCTYQDKVIFCGQSGEGFRAIDVSDEANFVEIGAADVEGAGADTDFATVLGNLVYLGNDHGDGAALIPHSMAPDSKPPELVKSYPGDGELNLPLSSRFTLFFSDEIDLGTVNPENIKVRKADGTPLDGVFTHSSVNAISFGPRGPLEPESTYEIVMTSGGVKDLAQNPIASDIVVRFSTGTMLDPSTAGGGSGGGGMGGMPGGEVGGTASGGMPNVAGTGSPAGAAPVAGGPMLAPTTDEASGCGCSVPGGSLSSTPAWLVVVGLLAARLRRRKTSQRD